MALNKNNKFLTRQILPEVEININLNGITISSDRLIPSRFVPFEQGGKCRECKSTEVEVDFVVTKDGITIYCTRISGTRFVPFDNTYDLPGICFFRIKNKGRVFNIPYGSVPISTPQPLPHKQQVQNKQEKQKQPNQQKNIKNDDNKENELLEEFFDNLNATTTGIPQSEHLKNQAAKEQEEMTAIEALYNIPH